MPSSPVSCFIIHFVFFREQTGIYIKPLETILDIEHVSLPIHLFHQNIDANKIMSSQNSLKQLSEMFNSTTSLPTQYPTIPPLRITKTTTNTPATRTYNMTMFAIRLDFRTAQNSLQDDKSELERLQRMMDGGHVTIDTICEVTKRLVLMRKIMEGWKEAVGRLEENIKALEERREGKRGVSGWRGVGDVS